MPTEPSIILENGSLFSLRPTAFALTEGPLVRPSISHLIVQLRILSCLLFSIASAKLLKPKLTISCPLISI